MGYGGDFNAKRKKIATIVVSSVLLVAMIGAVTYGTFKQDGTSGKADAAQVKSSTKAIRSVCAPTQYKITCEQSLASANTTEPMELVKVAFAFAEKSIGDVLSKSALIQEAEKDPRTKGALDVCKVVLNNAIDDFKRSSSKIGKFDASKIDSYAEDLKTWLSGTVTYQETCIDAFQNTTGNAGERMKALLKTSGELASNGIAMVSGIADVLSQLKGVPSAGRRLLQTSDDDIPSFVDDDTRRILFGQAKTIRPNATVCAVGNCQFKTINDAIATIPKGNNQTFIIFVRAGVYNEHVEIPKRTNKVVLIGAGPTKTKITGNRNYADGTNTFNTATFAVNGDYFLARDIGFENSAGAEKHQAVAVRVSGDYAVFFNCQMDGYQDTLYVHTYRQFYRDCTITGTIDFVFGDAAAIFQNCKFIVRKPMENQNCMVTAQGRKDPLSVGVIVLQKCQILADPAYLAAKLDSKSYLGRPWKEFSRTIIMNTAIDAFIDPEGFAPWMGTFALDTLYYGEYQNTGPGANIAGRVHWKGIRNITPQIADSFTPGKYFRNADFITIHRIPFVAGMMA
ncbi:esterase [Lithospermum erythrorhizon]|uniref:Pectinesterase n=1 Tax=Lithospermum erythrorhizon TaxID=34254 RepID=A0AAV3P708_LITER